MKARVSFLLDTEMLSLPQDTDLRAYVLRNMLGAARSQLKRELHDARRNTDLASEDKARVMADRMRAIMSLLMVEANLVVEDVADTTVVETMLPHETA